MSPHQISAIQAERAETERSPMREPAPEVRNSSSREIDDDLRSRGRQPRADKLPMEYRTFSRPPDIVKNITKSSNATSHSTNGHTSDSRSHIRSREASLSALKELSGSTNNMEKQYSPRSKSNSNSKSSSLRSNQAGKEQQLRTRRFKSVISAYNDDAVLETALPNQTQLLYQKYQRNQLLEPNDYTPKEKSNNDLHPQAIKNLRMSVSMDNELVPAFDDLTMDLGDVHVPTTGEFDNKFTPRNSGGDITSSHTFTLKEQLNETSSTPKHLGRIQQRLFNMKEAAQDSSSGQGLFENVEQKVLFESLNRELKSLSRFNHKPLVSSLRRVHEFELSPDMMKLHQKSGSKFLMKTYDPLNQSPFYQKPVAIEARKDVQKLQEMLLNANSTLRDLWEDSTGGKYQSQLNTKMNKSIDSTNSWNGRFNTAGSVEEQPKFPETRAIREKFEGFKLGTNGLTSSESYNVTDPSPKTRVE